MITPLFSYDQSLEQFLLWVTRCYRALVPNLHGSEYAVDISSWLFLCSLQTYGYFAGVH